MATAAPIKKMWGHSENNLDEKGRLVVPQKFREALGTEFVLTVGPGKHIRAYPKAVWEQLEDILTSDDPMDELDRDLSFLQRMFGACETVNIDAQERITVPRHLRDWASVPERSQAICIGAGDRVEIWSRENYKTYMEGFKEEDVNEAMTKRRAAKRDRAAQAA